MIAMRQGTIELRSGLWSWRLLEPGEVEGEDAGSLRLSAVEREAEEMEARVPTESRLSDQDLRGIAEQASLRRFTAEDGTVWTAELRTAPPMPGVYRSPSPMVMFWSANRACLTTLKPRRGLGEMTVTELRAHLAMCLSS